jgi:hypothetical protein
MNNQKIIWHGTLIAIQARIKLMRSFDERSHSYLGYNLFLHGQIGNEKRDFSVAIGDGTQEKFQFRSGDEVSGEALPVADKKLEPAEFYKTSKLALIKRPEITNNEPPPWLGLPPDLQIYRARGHRRLDARTYSAKCTHCIWGCQMSVEMIIDHWNPGQKRYRFETFCYGPKSCPSYKAGPTRKVPGRNSMSYEEEDWVDEDSISHRGLDE